MWACPGQFSWIFGPNIFQNVMTEVSPLHKGPMNIVRMFQQKLSNGSPQILRKAQNT